jgi:hypothetical protein
MNIVNRLLGLLVGLLLLAAGVVVVIEAVLALLDRPGWLVDRQAWDAFLLELAWDHRGLLVVAGLLVLAGVALLLLQLRSATPTAFRLAGEDPHRDVTVEGRGLQELLRRRAAEDEDVLSASVRVRSRNARVSVQVPPDADEDAVRDRVKEAVDARIADLGLERPLTSKVDAQRSRERVR